MRLASGCRFGKYEIVQRLGSGGMGEVFRGRDVRLGRDVALKVLPERLRVDAGRLARFEREARVLASLNHPNIGTLLEIETDDGAQALVLELVDGETLAERLARGALPLGEALSIARQVAAALESAHDNGVVHRDVKPANVKLRSDGAVKLLDFGLAEIRDPGLLAGAPHAATLSAPALEAPTAGTPSYMSPEQTRGRSVDQRSDIWAFGCVLFEMLTGRRAFSGDTVGDTIAAVLEREPDWSALRADVPASIRRLLRRCLEKDRNERLRHIGDAGIELKDVQDLRTARRIVEESRPAAPRARAELALLALAAAALGAAGAAATFALLQPSAAPARDVARFELTGPASLPLAEAPLAHTLAISPDGRRIAYGSADGSLTIRPLEALELTRLPRLGTEVRSPVFSLDGRFIAFFDDRALNVVSARGGSPVSWAELDSRPWGAAFAPDGSIVVAGAGGLARVPSGGGVPEVLTPLDAARGEHAFDAPALLPRGRAVLFAIRTAKRGGRARIAVLDLATRTRKELLDHGTQPRYLPPGHLVYAHASTLKAVAFDPERLEVLSTPVTLARGVAQDADDQAAFALADNGTLVYVPAGGAKSGARAVVVLNWLDEVRGAFLRAP